jgi:hypothetical protein
MVLSGLLMVIIGVWLLLQTLVGELAPRLVSYATSSAGAVSQ